MAADDNGQHAQRQARRGSVTRTFEPVSVLAGFMDDPHFRGFAHEHLASLSPDEEAALMDNVSKARDAANNLPPLDWAGAEVRPLDPAAHTGLESDPIFASIFGNVSYRFSWVQPEKLVALQSFVKLQEESVPRDADSLIAFALPQEWRVPAEISFMPPVGPIYVVSSSPQMAGLQVRMDAQQGQVILEPPSHVNLIQAVQFAGRYYLRNGYHRVVGAIAAGITELPALVVDVGSPAEVEIPQLGLAGFNPVHSMGLLRPPLVSDFGGAACVEIPMRERRYGASVSLQISPLNIGI